jgi:hypothetical protein
MSADLHVRKIKEIHHNEESDVQGNFGVDVQKSTAGAMCLLLGMGKALKGSARKPLELIEYNPEPPSRKRLAMKSSLLMRPLA